MEKGNVTLTQKQSAYLAPEVLMSLQNVDLQQRTVVLSSDLANNVRNYSDYLDTEEVCALTKFTRDTICKWCRNGKVLAKKIRGRWKINKKSLQEHLLKISKIHFLGSDNIAPNVQIKKRVEKQFAFISYSHKDSDFLKEFRIHISHRLESKVNVWCDKNIVPGSKWKKEIEEAIQCAKVVILLISAHFFKSRFINQEELPAILQAAEEEGTIILAVYLKFCDYEEYPEIIQYQAINSPDNPIATMNPNDRDKIWVGLIKEIKSQLGIKAPNNS